MCVKYPVLYFRVRIRVTNRVSVIVKDMVGLGKVIRTLAFLYQQRGIMDENTSIIHTYIHTYIHT